MLMLGGPNWRSWADNRRVETAMIWAVVGLLVLVSAGTISTVHVVKRAIWSPTSFQSWWLSRFYIYIILNFIIITIAASSSYHYHDHDHDGGGLAVDDSHTLTETPPPSTMTAPHFQHYSTTFSSQTSRRCCCCNINDSPQQQQLVDHNNSHTTTPSPPQGTSSSFSSKNTNHIKGKSSPPSSHRHTLEEAIGDGGGGGGRQLKKSDTWKTAGKEEDERSLEEAWRELRKSETFNHAPRLRVGLRRDPSLSLDELNHRVESFINKFNHDMRLQRQESDQRFLEMINRGV
uniref:DUF4408 domain-containing protein n=1 Tax=Davidia involucrata TaxID=16924 RepID=A0A5B7CC37_DAVIN